MKTKIILATCVLVIALCLVGCTAQSALSGTAWKSDKAGFLEEKISSTILSNEYTATLLFLKDGVMSLELYIPQNPSTSFAIGTWSANANQLTYDISADWKDSLGYSYQFQGTTSVKIDKITMLWLDSNGSANTTWAKVTK